MQINIRKAQLEDASLLAELNATVQGLHAQAYPTRFQVPNPKDPVLISLYEEKLQEETTHIYIAEDEGQAIGHIVCQHSQREANPYTLAFDSLRIDEITVNESHQGKGVGYALMQTAESLAHELKVQQLSLGVWAFNEKAIEFYKRLGFDIASMTMWKRFD